MNDAPQIVDSPAQMAAVIRLTIPRHEIQQAMGPAFGELMSALAAQGLTPAGPFFSHHFAMNPDTFDFEVGVPVASAVTALGRVRPGELPAARVARTIYRGPYEGLGDAWCEFENWLTTSGHTSAPNLWECYVAGPESGPDPTAWRTELNRPLAKENHAGEPVAKPAPPMDGTKPIAAGDKQVENFLISTDTGGGD